MISEYDILELKEYLMSKKETEFFYLVVDLWNTVNDLELENRTLQDELAIVCRVEKDECSGTTRE